MNFTDCPELETKVKSAMNWHSHLTQKECEQLDANAKAHFQHILKQEVTLDAEPYATIPAGTPLFGEEQKGFVVFQFGEHMRQIPKSCFREISKGWVPVTNEFDGKMI